MLLEEQQAAVGPHGIPWADALDPAADGWFEIEERVDFAQAALERWKKDADKRELEPGTVPVVRDMRKKNHESKELIQPES